MIQKQHSDEADGRWRATKCNLTATYRFVDDKEENQGAIWPKSVFEEANKLYELDCGLHKLRNFASGSACKVVDIYGRQRFIKVPKEAKAEPRLLLSFRGIARISRDFGDDDKLKTDGHDRGVLYELVPMGLTLHKQFGLCQHESPPWEFWRNSWNFGAMDYEGKLWCRGVTDKGELHYGWKSTNRQNTRAKDNAERVAATWVMLSDRLKTFVRKYDKQLKHVN